jgi:hypothetical protein
MNTVFQYFTENPVIAGCLVLVILEQLLMLFPGTYPYTPGFPIKIIPVESGDEIAGELLSESLANQRCRVRLSDKTIYFRKKLPEGI